MRLFQFLVAIIILTVISCTYVAAESVQADPSVGSSAYCMAYEKLWDVPVSSGINDVAISGDGSHIAVGGDKVLLYYDSQGKRIWENEIGLIETLGVSENGSRFVSGGVTLDIYDSKGNSIIRKDNGYFIKSIAVSADGDVVYYATDKGDLVIYSVADESSSTIDVGFDLLTIAVPENGGYIAGGSRTADLILMNSNGVNLWTRESCVEKPVMGLDMSSKGDFIVYTADETINALFRTGNLLWEKKIPDVGGVTVDSDGSLIAVAHGDGITLFDRQGNEILNIPGMDGVNNVDISDDGSYLAFCCKDRFGLYSLTRIYSSETPSYDAELDAGIMSVAGEDLENGVESSEETTVNSRAAGISGIVVTIGVILSVLIFVSGSARMKE